jgi:hypothetical protein
VSNGKVTHLKMVLNVHYYTHSFVRMLIANDKTRGGVLRGKVQQLSTLANIIGIKDRTEHPMMLRHTLLMLR